MEAKFNTEELCHYTMTEKEEKIWKNVKDEILEICKRLDIPPKFAYGTTKVEIPRLEDTCDFWIKYKEEYGFYEVIGDRGYKLVGGSHHLDKDEFLIYLLESEIIDAGRTIELSQRDYFEKLWNEKKHFAGYDSRKFAFEYTIGKFKKINKKKYLELIDEYTDFMNRWFSDNHWRFDMDEFVEISDSKEID